MSTLRSGMALASRDDLVSPELVLVDPELAVRARQGLADPEDTLARRSYSEPRPPARADDPAAAAAAAARRLALAAQISDPVVTARPSRSRRLVAGVAATSAGLALALLVADRQWEPGQAPVSPEVSAPRTLASSESEDARPSPAPSSTAPREATTTVRRDPDAAFRPTPHRFAWAAAERASGYHVELYREASRVFAANTVRPQITIPTAWTHDGRRYRLEAVEYRWYVWPIVAGRRASQAIVRATLVVRDR